MSETKIAEGRMVMKRIKLRIPPMRGEAIVRELEPPASPAKVEQPEEKEK